MFSWQAVYKYVATGTDVAVAAVDGVRDAGADYKLSSWAIEVVGGKSYIVFIDEMLQLSGMLQQGATVSHVSYLVCARLFRFSFELLHAKVESNRVSFCLRRMLKLLRTQREKIGAAIDSTKFGALPCHFARMGLAAKGWEGCWPWETADMRDMLLSSEDLFRPVHLASETLAEEVIFTFR